MQEVWVWKDAAIQIFSLRGSEYVPVERSEVLAEIDLEVLLRFVDVKPMTRAVTEYRGALASRA